jgi:hypothetical protein
MRIKLFTSSDYEDKAKSSKLDYILSRTSGLVFDRLLLYMPNSPYSFISICFDTT